MRARNKVKQANEASEALRLSEERLRLALTAAGQGLYDLDLTTGKAEVNPQYAVMLGYDPATFQETDLRWAERLHPEDREKVYPIYQAYIRGDIPDYKVEFRLRTKSGDWKWILSVGSIVSRDQNGRPLRMLGTHTDITERKQVEEALQASKTRLDFLIGRTPAVIYSAECSDDYAATFISPNITTQLGYHPADFINDPSFWVNHIHPEDKERVLAGMAQFFAGGLHSHEHEYRFQHKDGSYRWMHDEVRLVRDGAGNPVELIGYWINVTKRKKAEDALRRSEEEFRSAFEISSVGMCQADPFTGRMLRVNHRFCEMTGYSEAELLNRSFQDITHPEDREKNFEEYSALVRGEIPHYQTEKRYVRKDGNPIWVDVTANLVRDAGGQPLRSLAVIRDITEYKRLEQEKRHAAVLEERNRLARDVHDNLAQGLASIVLQLEGAEQILSESVREARKHIVTARDLARGSLEEARRSLLAMRSSLLDHEDLPSALSHLVDSLELAWSSHADLTIHGKHHSLSPRIEENLLRIAQEALQNAVRHGNARQMRVELGYHEKLVTLGIQDDGKGFELAGDRRTTSLGITIMRERCAEIRARFDIQSEPGKGTRVMVEVPISEEMRAAAAH
jgi:PAS domain S-box-containing protein